MNMAKKAVAVMCGIMIALMSFTLTDLGNAIGGFPAYEEEKRIREVDDLRTWQ